METSTQHYPAKPFNRFDIPVKFGIITGLLVAVLSTIQFMFLVESYGGMMVAQILIFLITVLMYYITGVQQRKAMGGFIDIRQAFSAIFITILISVSIVYIYNYIYVKFIDPDVIDRISNSSITFAEKMGAPQEKLDEIAEQIEDQKGNGQSVGKQLLSFLSQIVLYSIFGFICAAIVKKKRPVHVA